MKGTAMVRLIGQLVRPYRRFLLVAVVAVLIQVSMTVAAPWPLKILIDSVAGDKPPPQWLNWSFPLPDGGNHKMHVAMLVAATVVVIAAVNSAAAYFNIYFSASIGQWLGNDLRIRMYHHLQRLSLRYYHTHQVGAILSTITADVATIQNFVSVIMLMMFKDVLAIVGMLIVMFALRPDFALITLAVVPFLIISVIRIGSAIQKATKVSRQREADIVAAVQEGLESVEAVEAFELEELEERQVATISRGAVEAALKARRVYALLLPVINIPVALCIAFVFWRGSSLLLAGSLTLGTLQIFANYLARFFEPVQDFSQQASPIAQTAVSVQRINAILDADTMIKELPDATQPSAFRGQIAFEHVAFDYDDASNDDLSQKIAVLHDICFAVEPGHLVGIVGPTGSGKSTIVSLIPRFYDADSGIITIDGTDIRDLKLHGLRSQIGFVQQDTILFRGTIHDNIAFGRPDATREEVVEAAKLANADEFITRMPKGYDSLVTEHGATLSGGQRQRIGIARALIRNNPILILDEPTAALDAESEHLVIEALKRLMEGRTVFCIAHRLSTIRDADLILVIKDGVVAEQGTHEELLALDGLYAELHRIQYGEASPRANPPGDPTTV
jgi:ABC-type multidrug transport system fused ATPase/permease subunit